MGPNFLCETASDLGYERPDICGRICLGISTGPSKIARYPASRQLWQRSLILPHLLAFGWFSCAHWVVTIVLISRRPNRGIAPGNWGCPPEQYPAALALVLEGKVVLEPFVERHSLDEAPAVLEAV
ncbi:MAG: hypothetical protein ABSE85_05355, partial [Candidatus Korobacteraceae bacterium]